MEFNSKVNPALFIAEVGSNHEGIFSEAKKLVFNACKSQADVIKLQIFSAENMVSKLYDQDRYNHFKKLELSQKQNIELFKIIKSFKKKTSASIWDVDQIKFFNKYIDVYKVGSGDIHNFQIIKKILNTGKPLIVSTGLSSMSEIKETLDFVKKNNKSYFLKKKIAILHCNTAYPSPKEDSYLGTIKKLQEKFKINVGFSDHSIGDEILVYAFICGATIIEKHFSNTLSKKTFRDHQISLNKNLVNLYLKKIRDVSKYLKVKEGLSYSEKKQKNTSSFRRSIYAKQNINIGQKFSENNVICLRPFKSNSSKNYFKLLNKRSKKKYKAGDLISL